MLLNQLLRRPAGDLDPRDRGSALAAVVAIVAISGVIAATLLTAAMFSTGFTSASRAGVQAQAASEAGVDYATANLTTCVAGSIVSAAGTTPRFSVAVSHRSIAGGTWTTGCPPTGALETRLVSTGWAAHPGAAGHDRGNTRTMEAILRAQFHRAIVGDKGIRISGNLEFLASGRTADVSTMGDFQCNGGVIHTDTLYVGGAFLPNTTGNCGRTGPLVQGAAVGPADDPINVFPKVFKNDRRWPTDVKTPAWLASRLVSSGSDPCTITRTSTATIVLSPTPVLVDATSCVNGLTLNLNATLALAADVVILANKLTTDQGSTLKFKSNDAAPKSLFLVRPWPADRVGGCESDPPDDFVLNGDMQSMDTLASVLLYSSTEIVTGSRSGKNPLNGQIYGCKLYLQGAARINFVPVGSSLVAMKRDL